MASVAGDDKTQDSSNEQSAEASINVIQKSGDSLHVSRGPIRAPSPDASILSLDDVIDLQHGRVTGLLSTTDSRRDTPGSPGPSRNARRRILDFWTANKGLAMVMASQFFGTLMNVTTRILEREGNDGKGYHPFQVLFARMIISVLCASLYMWYKSTEHFPFGRRDVRALLIARGLTGFFGVFGMYYSLMYLPLADATVITFLAPSLACWACSFLINEPFTRMEQIAAYISLFGVVLIARPVSLFAALSRNDATPPARVEVGISLPPNATSNIPEHLASDYDSVTPAQRATAVGIAMLGVFGAAGAYTTVRWIGKRAHPLLSVNYFAAWCTIVSFVAMFAIPGVGFLLPRSLKDWTYLIFLGICGFIMQFLLAAGLQYEKSSRATNMVYVQMLFALTFDKLVFGTSPGVLSIIGSSLILGSAIYVAMHKEHVKKEVEGRHGGEQAVEGEEALMLTNVERDHR